MNTSEVRSRLVELADPKYRAFSEKLVPGARGVLGVRLPDLRALAKQIAREGLDEFEPGDVHEEIMLFGLALGYAKLELNERLMRLDRFVPRIDNWAVCDSCVMTYKFMEKARGEVWPWLIPWLDHENPFATRFVLVAMLAHFICDEYVDRVLETVDGVRSEHYYIRMGAAWLVAECYVKYPEHGRAYLMNDHLDDFTHNKAIQKIRESFRPDDAEKQALLALKRKGAAK